MYYVTGRLGIKTHTKTTKRFGSYRPFGLELVALLRLAARHGSVHYLAFRLDVTY